MKLHVIYIPGIGDDRSGHQSKIVKTWRWWGIDSELYSMDWANSRPWKEKFQEFVAHIDDLSSQGKKIGLVGASAGASAAINAYAARGEDVIGVVTIAGKINRPQNIGARYRNNNPSFVDSAYAGEESLASLSAKQREHMLAIYGTLDEVIARRDSKISGGHNRLSLTIGHGVTIAIQIIFGAPFFLRFLKHQVKPL
jgi:dienelactone hydrolase